MHRCRWPTATVVAAMLLALAPRQPAAAGTAEAPIPDTSTLAPTSVTAEVIVPRDGLWRIPQSTFALPDTVRVVDKGGQALQRCEGEPQRGQFRYRLDGAIRFAAADRGLHVTVSYQYRPRRLAMLAAVVATGYDDAAPALREALADELAKRGFIVLAPDDVADALAAVGASTPLLPEKAMLLADRLNAAYLLVPGVAADESRVLAGFSAYTHSNTSGASQTHTLTPVTRNMMNAAVGITVLDGTTGQTVAEQARSGSRRVRFRQFAPARRDLIRDLAGQVVTAWREPAL